MIARCVLLALLALALASAQNADIFERLRRVFASPAEGDRAAAELARRNFAQVQSMLARQEQANPGEVFSLEGAVAFLSGDMQSAIQKFSFGAATVPLRDADRFTLAMAFVKAGDDQHAREILAALQAKYPDRALYIYWLGKLDYDQRRYLEAVPKLEHAAQLDPKSARVWDALGLAFDMQGRMDQALGAFEKASTFNRAEAHPSPWPPHNLGYLLLRMNRLPEAETALRESLRYDPALAISEYHLGRVLEKQDRDPEAIEEYKKAVASDAASSEACYSLAMLYRKTHRDTDAQAMFAEYRRRKASQP